MQVLLTIEGGTMKVRSKEGEAGTLMALMVDKLRQWCGNILICIKLAHIQNSYAQHKGWFTLSMVGPRPDSTHFQAHCISQHYTNV